MADEFRSGIPRKETVEMVVPAAGQGQATTRAGTQALAVERQAQALRGETADFYKLTYGVSHLVNGGGALVLLLVKAVTSHPPTSIDANGAVWGPWTGDLEPITWKVTVTRGTGDHQYHYSFEGKAKGGPDAGYVTVLSGAHTAAVDSQGDPIEGFGRGDFVLDWDERAKLPLANPKEMGQARYVYSRMSLAQVIEVKAEFRKVRDDDTGKVVDVDYEYVKQPGAGGSMEFSHHAPPGMGAPAARWTVKSRWRAGGAGRSDVRAMGGDLPPGATATASECWDASFASTYLRASWAPLFGYGTETTDCVFPTAEPSKL
jgi:hypothetical protein